MDYKLSHEEIRLIQDSYNKISDKSEKIGEKFYNKLFEQNPEIIKLFKSDMKEQSHLLMNMVKTVIEGLNNPQIIIPAIQELGRRHNEYGVMPEMYSVFGKCLIDCIEQESGGNFQPETKQAWEKLYIILSDVMNGK